MSPLKLSLFVVFLLSSILSCTNSNTNSNSKNIDGDKPLQYFKRLSSEKAGVTFANKISENVNFNYFIYPFIYFGGGVALGDINNDALPDIYFTSNMGANALYLNKGNMNFEDITSMAGVEGKWNHWTTGVTMADVNNDGFLDIYVSVGGPRAERSNLLYINQGNGTFEEMAELYGIDDKGHSMQSTFFDYDKDGDLDLYVANYPPSGFANKNGFFAKKMKDPHHLESDKLYRNDGSSFVDVTASSGVLNYGLALGISIADFNQDNWPDIYVSNDFNTRDCLYINQGDGTFSNEIKTFTRHHSNFGMGLDAADINNDGLIDLLQLDMMASSNEQQKANMSAMDPDQFQDLIDNDLHYQYMKNTLQLNSGMGNFSEIGELAGLAYTDWSWGSLLADFNNDGWKDVFITNGMRRNVNDNDFNAYLRIQKAYNNIMPTQYLDLLDKIPIHPVENFAFLNNGDLTFKRPSEGYGLDFKGFSQGAAYADLDADGDLDLVVNNLDAVAHIYENVISSEQGGNYLRTKLEGEIDNKWGIGSKVSIFIKGKMQVQELHMVRGYQSSVDPVLHFGLGQNHKIDSVHVLWPNSNLQVLKDITANQLLEIRQNKNRNNIIEELSPPLFAPKSLELTPSYSHRENDFDDFKREVLLPHRMSRFGPALSVKDINGDGLDDFYIGGASGFAGAIYIQNHDGSFTSHQSQLWNDEKAYEDIAALFIDVNNDDFVDLFVVSGGNEKPDGDIAYQDRLYINDQNNNFYRSDKTALPDLNESGSCITASDFDKDGDVDLFIGGRQIPGKYPLPASGHILLNESNSGKISFRNVTAEIAPELVDIGMITAAKWSDFDSDGLEDIIIVGEWMSPRLFKNMGDGFVDVSVQFKLSNKVGWWNSLAVADLDNDGDMDFIAGNLGLNHKYKASENQPFKIYADDFDNNGNLDIVLGYYNQGELFPLRGRECSSQQMPSIKKKFPNYTTFSKANLFDVYSENISQAKWQYDATTFATTVFINEGTSFSKRILPNYAQFSAVNTIQVLDINKDENPDLILAGNQYYTEVETPRNDASLGLVLIGDGKGNFSALPPYKSGLNLKGEIKNIKPLKTQSGNYSWLVARNNDSLILLNLIKKNLP